MITENFKQAIRVVYYKLRKKNISWAFVGSTNMVLQGITNIIPKDLDIITHHKDLTVLESIFRDHVTEPITKQPPFKPGYPNFYELKLDINGVEVHALGEQETDIYYSRISKNRIIFVEFEEMRLPCLTLESEAEAYSETNRESKAKMIRDFLSNVK
ncbi:MAG: nucleotidyltransferase domain-containing protein [Promethearchaeota archaeon]